MMSPRARAALHRRLTEDHEQLGAQRSVPMPLPTPAPEVTPEPAEPPREQARLHSVRADEVVVPEPVALPDEILVPEPLPLPGPPAPPARVFPYRDFASTLDPGAVKARYLVGPIDPMIAFVGDLDERHGPDLLLRAMPPLLKRHPQARLVIVGDGDLLWPLKVMSRYMLLDYAVRIVGHVGGQPVRELVAAADVIAIPSRSTTEDWQLLAGWSAQRPVLATQAVTHGLCAHEENSLVVTPDSAACGAGLDRLLSDPELRRRLGEHGYRKVVAEFGGPPSDTQAS